MTRFVLPSLRYLRRPSLRCTFGLAATLACSVPACVSDETDSLPEDGTATTTSGTTMPSGSASDSTANSSTATETDASTGTTTGPSAEVIDCAVAILGGGAGGLHTAFRLADSLGAQVCLFEKENRLGGRIYDVSKDNSPSGPWIGVGARRIMETQEVVFGLAEELGITFEAVPFVDDLIHARGYFAHTSDELNISAYPLVADQADTETAFYDKLRQRENLAAYPEFRSYVRGTLGGQGYHYLSEVFRFRADFSYALDARGYLDYLDEEWDVCCTPSYPVGGMSEFIRKMEEKARAKGVRIFTQEPVLTLDKRDGRYEITTPKYLAQADKVVVAIDAGAFKHVGGALAQQIQAQPHFNSLVGVKVASITQWWPNDWWTNAVPGKNTHRAWTTDSCINFIEIPNDAYGKNQLVTRSVYDDDMRCVAMWEALVQKGDSAAIEAEIARGLALLFPGVTIPQPERTLAHIWQNAWYWIKAGSPYTNAEIAQWAVAPLAGEEISLVGESYNPQRSGWSDGAYKSSIATLNTRFGLNLPGSALAGPAKPRSGSRRSERNSGGH